MAGAVAAFDHAAIVAAALGPGSGLVRRNPSFALYADGALSRSLIST